MIFRFKYNNLILHCRHMLPSPSMGVVNRKLLSIKYDMDIYLTGLNLLGSDKNFMKKSKVTACHVRELSFKELFLKGFSARELFLRGLTLRGFFQRGIFLRGLVMYDYYLHYVLDGWIHFF